MFNSEPVVVLCDFCGDPIVGTITNVGTSMEVILACKKCVGEDREKWDTPISERDDLDEPERR